MKLSILTATLLASCSPAYAQERCISTQDGYKILEEQYGEQRLFVGQFDGSLLEVFGNPETKSWSLVLTHPDGISCQLANGQGFETIPLVTGDPA